MSEPRQLDSLLKQMAASHKAELPSPDLIWWRAQILKKQTAKERIERPMMFMRRLAAVVCTVLFLTPLIAAGGSFASLEANPLVLAASIMILLVSVVCILLLLRRPVRH